MKKMWFFVVMIVLMAGCGNGSNEPKEIPPELTSLVGTKWKLVGFFDIEKNELEEPLVKEQEDCYTLEFWNDSMVTINERECFMAEGSMINVGFVIYYIIDYQNSTFDVEFMMRTLDFDYFDGERYCRGINCDQKKFELENNELRLYYTDTYNDSKPSGPMSGSFDGEPKPFYLLFKRKDV